MSVLVFCAAMLRGLLGRYQHVRERYCAYIQGFNPEDVLTSPHNVTSQKTIINILTAMRTSYSIKEKCQLKINKIGC
jgi:hypothetical protein